MRRCKRESEAEAGNEERELKQEGFREPVRGGAPGSENGADAGDKETSSLRRDRGGFKPVGFGGNVVRSSLRREKFGLKRIALTERQREEERTGWVKQSR